MTRLLTKQQAAAELTVSLRTIDRMLADGKLTPRRIGPRLVRIDCAEIEQIKTGRKPRRRTPARVIDLTQEH